MIYNRKLCIIKKSKGLELKKYLYEIICILFFTGLGLVLTFSTYSTSFYNSLYNISEYYSSWKEAKISINRIKDFFDEMQLNNEDSDNNEYIDLDVLDGDIILGNISFTYDRNTILQDFSCRFKGRKCNLFIGQGGLGKTTICKLLLKFYEAERGQIQVGNVGLSQINRHQLHSLPLGVETVMGEAGNNFSEGQKQRLNIARGILKRPKIYIFDEPTSALYSKNREGIVKLIEQIIDKKR